MKIFYSEKHRLRQPKAELHGGVMVAPFECPERMDYVLAEQQKRGFGTVLAPEGFGLDPVLAVHDHDYIAFLQTAWQEWAKLGYQGEAIPTVWPARTMDTQRVPENFNARLGYYCLANETAITEGTWQAALVAKDIALSATKDVLGGARGAFGLCRPPGHHAAFDQYGGYCFLNNAAIATQYAHDQGVARMAVLDVDFHHGNGTQNIFYRREDVLFVSVHGDPAVAFPYYLGFADETGAGKGFGTTHNYPLSANTDFDVWSVALCDGMQKIQDFAPDVLVVSLGVDTFVRDPISFFQLASDDFITIGREIAQLGLPTVFVMEGGYAINEVGINTLNVLEGFWQA